MDAQVDRALARAEELLVAGWTRGAFARNALGESVDMAAPDACEWCLSGALARAVMETVPALPGQRSEAFERRSDLGLKVRGFVVEALRARGCERYVALWNDKFYRRKSQVIELIQEAREAARSAS